MAFISIVVPVYNAKRTIGQCLDSLIKQSFDNYEIIIVDNGSDDGSISVIENCIAQHPEKKIKLFIEQARGASQARNRGASESAGELLAFTDSDCVADSEWLKDTAAAFTDNNIGAVAGNIKGYKPQTLTEKFLSLFTLKGLDHDKIYTRYTIFDGGFPSANLTVKKDLFMKTGGFRGKIYGEDHDLCARLYQLGYSISYITNGIIYHMHRNTTGELIKQSYNFGECHARLFKVWGGRTLIIELPKYTIKNVPFPFPVWININNADKKMVLLTVPGFFSPVLLLLPVLYFLYLVYDTNRKCHQQHIQISFSGSIGLAMLLLIKSAAMSCGKLHGSFQERIICL